ncbi:lef-5 [Cnaphalocrocis medinalis granulovirus]|uniref:Lef-5 n=1 Tax=Cnaphalocrocis medinalis granulovirus TaxID=1750712 RepID=A0A120L155_9BBAC|nr:lef-5 [Cnaphalocrocis medinalis granulovirus]AMF83822.1 lef-5 [Cnaphalocrocis medinalis granulovirus]
MSFDQRPSVVQNNPRHLFEVFNNFREKNDYNGLVDYLITNYPQNVKNRTFNFYNTGHTFHVLYAYVPSASSKERKQIRLDCIEKLLQNTTNDFRLYKDLMSLMTEEHECPCELISSRLHDNIVYNEKLKTKHFDTKPCKLKKEPIDAILFKYSINWKNVLIKKRASSLKPCKKRNNVQHTDGNDNDVKNNNNDYDYIISLDDIKPLLSSSSSSSLTPLAGQTIVQQCAHVYIIEEKQLRAGDEIVSFVKYCKICGAK